MVGSFVESVVEDSSMVLALVEIGQPSVHNSGMGGEFAIRAEWKLKDLYIQLHLPRGWAADDVA